MTNLIHIKINNEIAGIVSEDKATKLYPKDIDAKNFNNVLVLKNTDKTDVRNIDTLYIKDVFFIASKNSRIPCGYFSELSILGYTSKQRKLHEYRLNISEKKLTDKDSLFTSMNLTNEQFNALIEIVYNCPILRNRCDDKVEGLTTRAILDKSKNMCSV